MSEVDNGLPSPERLLKRTEMVALHTRMAVCGEALNPEKKLEEIKEENLGNLDQTILAAANGSTKERDAYWKKRWQEMASPDSSLASLDERQKLEKQKEVWRRLMVERFKAENNQLLVAKLKAKKQLGGINFEGEFSQETAAQIYKRYFEEQKQENQEEVLVIKDGQQEKLVIPSNLNQFVDDVIETYQGNLEAIEQDLEAIVWYAGIFGNQMANKVIFEIIRTKLILANETKKQELITQANANDRRNTLTKTEKEFCQWLWEGSGMERRIIQEKITKPQTKQTSDWENLKNFSRFENPKFWENATQIREIFTNSEVAKKGLPIYYPGSGFDIAYPLAFTDADKFVFVDYVYINQDGSLNKDHLPDNEIVAIGGKIISVETKGSLGKGGKRIVRFEWGGKERTLVEYAEDAAKFTPQELKNGASFIIIKAPTPFGRLGVEPGEEPGNIMQVENIAKIYPNLAVGGFINWVPNLFLSPEILGFKEIISPPDDKLHPSGFPLYQKIREEPKILDLLKFDQELAIAIYIRNGIYSFDEKTLDYFKDQLTKVKEMFKGLPPDKQQAIQPVLQKLLLPENISDELHRILMQNGLGDQQKAEEYLRQSKNIVFEIFPELKIPQSTPEIKSISEIVEQIKEKVSANQSCEMQFDENSLKMILENVIPTIQLKQGPISAGLNLTQPPEIVIVNQKGKVKLPLQIAAGLFGKHNVTLTLDLDNQFNCTAVQSDPPQILGKDVSKIVQQQLQQKSLSYYLQYYLQQQLQKQKAGITLETPNLQFTPENQVKVRIRGKKQTS